MIYYLTYSSKTSYLFKKGDLSRILTASREHNMKCGLTGLLLYNNNSFIQVLEGDEVTVKQLFSTIQADKRHNGVTKLMDGYTEHRQFPDWAMGYRQVDNREYEEINGELELSNKVVLKRSATAIFKPVSILLRRYMPVSQ